MSDSKVLFVFPGQGSQYSGMGSDIVAEFDVAAKLYDEASDIAGYDMRELSFSDSDGKIDRTRYTQPALLTHEVACHAAFQSMTGGKVQPAMTAGHSLGEYSALVVGGALSFANALRLVIERGRLMSELGRGGMLATTMNLRAATVLADKYFCGIGGCNLPEQTVIAGEAEDLDRLQEEMAVEYPKKRGFRLNTEGAFHTYLMVNAAQEFRHTLEQTTFDEAAVDVLSNYTGKLHVREADAIRSRLFFQLFNPVKWVACMNTAIDEEVTDIVEFGGGIGKGEAPADKRPNLEGIIKKSLKWRDYSADYLPAINVDGLRSAAEHFAS